MLKHLVRPLPEFSWEKTRRKKKTVARIAFDVNKQFVPSHILGKQLDYTSESGDFKQYYQEVNGTGTRKLL